MINWFGHNYQEVLILGVAVIFALQLLNRELSRRRAIKSKQRDEELHRLRQGDRTNP